MLSKWHSFITFSKYATWLEQDYCRSYRSDLNLESRRPTSSGYHDVRQHLNQMSTEYYKICGKRLLEMQTLLKSWIILKFQLAACVWEPASVHVCQILVDFTWVFCFFCLLQLFHLLFDLFNSGLIWPFIQRTLNGGFVSLELSQLKGVHKCLMKDGGRRWKTIVKSKLSIILTLILGLSRILVKTSL